MGRRLTSNPTCKVELPHGGITEITNHPVIQDLSSIYNTAYSPHSIRSGQAERESGRTAFSQSFDKRQ